MDATDSPRKAHDKREPDDVSPGTEKKQKLGEDEGEQEGSTSLPSKITATRSREEGEEMAVSSPTKVARLYPPHYAGIQAIEAHGDEEVGQELIPEEINEELFAGYGGNEDEEPPITSDEHLQLLDEQAKRHEVERMLQMPAMERSNRSEVEECDGYTISTKFVITWKHRLEKGGWFRRARLVARQLKSSVDLDQTFAPTSIMVLPKMLIHLMINVFKHFRAMTLDIKDAFLMADQPAEERAFVELDGQIYRLIKCLPGQRTAASQWFQLFVGAAKKFGLKQDAIQPTLLMMEKEMYITVHVDDIFMVGNEATLKSFVQYMQKKKGWNIEVKGPFNMNEKFHYLKREFWPGTEGCDIRCDYKQYESLAKDTDVYKKAYRKTPMDQNFAKKDESPLLEAEDITKYRSVVQIDVSGRRKARRTVQHPKLSKKHGEPHAPSMEERVACVLIPARHHGLRREDWPAKEGPVGHGCERSRGGG